MTRFDLPEQPLADSLRALGGQANINILFDPPLVSGRRAPALKAELTPEQALSRLLANTGIQYQFLNETTVVLAFRAAPTASSLNAQRAGPDPSSDSNGQKKEGKKDSSGQFLMAQAVTGQADGTDSVERQDNHSEKKIVLEEVVVTGSRIPTVAGSLTVPLQVYTRSDIERTGQTTVSDFLNTLPDVSTSYRQDGSLTGIPGLSTIQLHGLPVGTTLTLLDGYRLEQNGTFGLVDLSNIPLSAVDRIEVLPVGTSAIYGSDALAGAVNIMLRKDFRGLAVEGIVSHASAVVDTGANLSWGDVWDHSSMSVMGFYQRRGQLLGADRVPTGEVVWPASLTPMLNAGDCTPGEVFTLDGSNLPGLNSPVAAIPAGIVGKPSVQQFAAGAGQQAQCNSARTRPLLPASTNAGVLLSAHYKLSEAVDLFTQTIYSHTERKSGLGLAIDVPNYYAAAITATNPFNPFGEDVGVSFSYPGILAPRETSTESLIRPLVGIRGTLAADWTYEVTSYLSQARLNAAIPGINLGNVFTALGSSDPAGALNPFTTGSPGSPSLLESLITIDPGNSYYLNEADQIVAAQALVRGPLVSLPPGPAQGAIGVDYHQEKQDADIGLYGVPFHSFLQRKNYAAFAEARIPLLSQREEKADARLALTLAGRYDHSGDYGGKATWQSGLLWRATDTLAFVSSYGISYQAPTLQELATPQVTQIAPSGTVDPFRGNQPVPLVPIVGGPNPNLHPETGDALTLGLTYSSRTVAGLRASFSYFKLKLSGYIATHNLQDLIDYPNLFPGAVVRAPPTPQDQQQGFLGQIIQLNDVNYNFGDLRVAGVDTDASYAFEAGQARLTPSLALAYVGHWQSALTPNSPPVNYVSQANASLAGGGGWAPRWKGTAAIALTRGPVSVTLVGRYVGPYRDYQILPNTNELGNSWFVDLSARYESAPFITGTGSNRGRLYLAMSAVDVLNKTPPFSFNGANYDSSQYDIRGRLLTLQLGVQW